MTDLSSDETDLYGAELEEHVDGLDAALLALDGVHDPNSVAIAFRHLHSVKSGAASMGFSEVQRLAHRLEDAFCVLRDSDMPASAELLAVAFEANDRFRRHLDLLSPDGRDFSRDIPDVQDLITRIGVITEGLGTGSPTVTVSADQSSQEPTPASTFDSAFDSTLQGELLSVMFDGSRPLIDLKATAVLQRLTALTAIGDPSPPVDALDQSGFVMRVPVYRSVPENKLDSVLNMDGVLAWSIQEGVDSTDDDAEVSEDPYALGGFVVPSEAHGVTKSTWTTKSLHPSQVAERRSTTDGGVTSLRVSVSSLDLLADLSGELVTVRSRLTETLSSVSSAIELASGSTDANDLLSQRLNSLDAMIPNLGESENRLMLGAIVAEMRAANQELGYSLRQMEANSQLKSALARVSEDLNRVVGRLQEATIDLRLVPLEPVFRRFRRVVHGAALAAGKDVDLVIRGERTGVDKRLIDGLSEPLTHLVRNAIDHGLEAPEERRRIGKPAKGQLILSAAQQGNSVVIELSDDGRGINVEAVRGKLVADGRIDADKAAQMSRDDIIAFLFLPGVTTKTQVTELSGRGVGLDAVQAMVARVHGTVELSSEVGRGTTISLRLPSAMAIVNSLIVTVGSHHLGIPIEDVREVVSLDEVTMTPVGNERTLLLRGEFLPVLDLHFRLQLPYDEESSSHRFAVVLSTGSREVACLIDSAVGTEDLVIKSVADSLGSRRGLSGASFLGDGNVALIVDSSSLLGARQ
ncbi:MAG: chemotaxis protein CheA [Acidimicrobiia bacterium]|nr:chemotaxis protein CheA [Acidimicrobiia bacterium]